MPSEKNTWDDVPNNDHVKDKDKDKDIVEKWIKCNACNVSIIVRIQFSFIESNKNCSSTKYWQ